MEASPNIMYMGASPNQQVVPAVDYCAEHFGKKMFLVGSDYIFPRTANRIIKAQLAQMDGICVGEVYVPMGGKDFSDVIEDILNEKPDVIINSINGDSNIYFFKQLEEAGISYDKIPIMSFSISEEEINKIGVAGYIAVYMWALACEKAQSFDVEEVRIGKINDKGLIDEIWATPGSIKPVLYLSTYEWARGIQD